MKTITLFSHLKNANSLVKTSGVQLAIFTENFCTVKSTDFEYRFKVDHALTGKSYQFQDLFRWVKNYNTLPLIISEIEPIANVDISCNLDSSLKLKGLLRLPTIKNLKSLMKFTSRDKSEFRPFATTVCINDTEIVATDAHILKTAKSDTVLTGNIPREVIKLMIPSHIYQCDGGWALTNIEYDIFYKTPDFRYPDYSVVFPDRNNLPLSASISFYKKDLRDSMAFVSTYINPDYKRIRLSCSNSVLSIWAIVDDMPIHQSTTTIPTSNDASDEFSVDLDHEKLNIIISEESDKCINMKYYGHTKPVLFNSALIMPIITY